jgi:hypothetical protein
MKKQKKLFKDIEVGDKIYIAIKGVFGRIPSRYIIQDDLILETAKVKKILDDKRTLIIEHGKEQVEVENPIILGHINLRNSVHYAMPFDTVIDGKSISCNLVACSCAESFIKYVINENIESLASRSRDIMDYTFSKYNPVKENIDQLIDTMLKIPSSNDKLKVGDTVYGFLTVTVYSTNEPIQSLIDVVPVNLEIIDILDENGSEYKLLGKDSNGATYEGTAWRPNLSVYGMCSFVGSELEKFNAICINSEGAVKYLRCLLSTNIPGAYQRQLDSFDSRNEIRKCIELIDGLEKLKEKYEKETI